MNSCCSCWGGSQIAVGDESPRSIAETFACAAASGLLPDKQESLEQYRNKIPADPSKYQAPAEVIPPPAPISQPTASKPAVGTTGSEVPVVAVIQSPVIERPIDPPPLDLEPPSSPRSDPEESSRRNSNAQEDEIHDEGINESSEPEPVSVPIETSAPTEREISVSIPETTSAWSRSGSHEEASSPLPYPAENIAPLDTSNSTSKLAIPCTCNKGTERAREQGEAKMSGAGRAAAGAGAASGSGRGNEEDNEDVVGLRAPNRFIPFGQHRRSPFQRTSPVRSRSPLKISPALEYNVEDDDDDDAAEQRAYVPDVPAAAPERAAMASPNAVPRGLAVRIQPQARGGTARGRGRGRWRASWRGRMMVADDEVRTGRDGEMALGGESRAQERRERRLRRQAYDSMRASHPMGPRTARRRPDGVPAGFQPQQGDLLIRHRKWPGEPMMEFYDVQRHVIRERDQLLRQELQYDSRRDLMHCRASLRRATLVDVADAQGQGGQQIRWDDAGASQMDIYGFDQLRVPRNRYIFGRRFDAPQQF